MLFLDMFMLFWRFSELRRAEENEMNRGDVSNSKPATIFGLMVNYFSCETDTKQQKLLSDFCHPL